MKKIGIFSILLLAKMACASQFTNEDLQELQNILEQKSKHINASMMAYQQVCKDPFQEDWNTSYRLRLKSGIDCEFQYNQLDEINKVSPLRLSTVEIPFSTELQDIQLVTEEIEEMTNRIKTIKRFPGAIKMKHQYGQICTDKFAYFKDALGLIFKFNCPALIAQGGYRVENIVLSSDFTEQERKTWFMSGLDYLSVGVMRYLHPNTEKSPFGLFIRNDNPYDPEYHSERLILTFDVSQVLKPF